MDSSYSFRLPSNALRGLAAVVAALMTGMLWRIRGDHGFGGTWGMLAVTTCLLFLIVLVYPRKEKMSLEFFALTALTGALTAGGWGTIISQLAGKLGSTAEFTGEVVERTVEISPLSGLVTMLLLGFGWLPLFGYFLGQYFSARKYTFLNGVEGIVCFYVTSNLFKFTVAPLIYKLICPQAVTLFEQGLADRQIGKTPFAFFISVFGNIAKAKKIPGGRNYFTCCAVIGAALGALVLILWLRVRFKDKTAARVCSLICLSMAVAITMANLIMMYQALGRAGEKNVSETVLTYGWPLWEYFTGFIFGALALLVVLPFRHQSDDVKCFTVSGLSKPLQSIFGFISFFVVFCLVPVIAAGNRIDETPYIKNAASLQTAAYIIAAIIGLLVAVIFTVHNSGKCSPLGASPATAAAVACPVLVAVYALFYFFYGSAYAVYLTSAPITNLMLISFALFSALYALLILQITKGRNNDALQAEKVHSA